MFVAAEEPPAAGTRLYFTVLLADERCVLCGEGEVVWVAAKSAAAPPAETTDGAAGTQTSGPLYGFGLRFLRLDAKSGDVLRQVLTYKAAHPERFFTAPPNPDPYAAQSTAPIGLALAPSPARAASAVSSAGESRRLTPKPAASLRPEDEEAELKSLLRAAPPAPPSVGDTARLLDDLLRRRPL